MLLFLEIIGIIVVGKYVIPPLFIKLVEAGIWLLDFLPDQRKDTDNTEDNYDDEV